MYLRNMSLLLKTGFGFRSVPNERRSQFTGCGKPEHGSLSCYIIQCITALQGGTCVTCVTCAIDNGIRPLPLVYSSISMITTCEGTVHAASSDRPDISAHPWPRSLWQSARLVGQSWTRKTRTFWLLKSKHRQNSRRNIA
jgi:hypothetical protein